MVTSSFSTSQPTPEPKHFVGAGEAPRFFTSLSLDGVGITRLFLCDQRGVEVGVDYLAVSACFCTESGFLSALSLILDVESPVIDYNKGWLAGPGAEFFDWSICHPLVFGGVKFDEDLSLYKVSLVFRGEFFASFSLKQTYSFIKSLRRLGFYDCSRIDIRIDDFTFSFIPYNQMFSSGLSGNYFHARKFKPFLEFELGELISWGMGWGSRNSARYARTYIHDFTDTLGKYIYSSMRHEVEFKRDVAQSVFDALAAFNNNSCLSDLSEAFVEDSDFGFVETEKEFSEPTQETLDNFSKLLAVTALGFIDFRDRSVFSDPKKANVRDSKRFDWWQVFLEKLGGMLRFKRESSPPALPKQMRFLSRISRVFAKLKAGLQEDFYNFLDIVADFGQSRLDNKDLADIDYLLRFPGLAHDLVSDTLAF